MVTSQDFADDGVRGEGAALGPPGCGGECGRGRRATTSTQESPWTVPAESSSRTSSSKKVTLNKVQYVASSGTLWLVEKCVTHMEGCGSWRKDVLGYTVHRRVLIQ
jgi:hypothetical protein